MSNRNGSSGSGPPFAVIGTSFVVLGYSGVVELLEKNAAAQSAGNLAVGPVFRKVADDFRSWGRMAEPGWCFVSPEVGLTVVRLSVLPPTVSVFKVVEDEPGLKISRS